MLAGKSMSELFSQGSEPLTGFRPIKIGLDPPRELLYARLNERALKMFEADRLVDEVRSGSSYISNSDMRVHFGVGAAAKVEWVEIHWPSGLVERFADLAADAIHTVKEGSGKAVQADPKKQ